MAVSITSNENISSFLTNVGLITSNGPFGHNVMACEWTHQISYDPPLIVLAIRDYKTTYKNIIESKEFGINIAADDQTVFSAVSGNRSGKDVDKIKMLEELGFAFVKAKHINTLMVKGASANIECKLVETIDIGDHPLLVGEIVSFRESGKSPLVYHQSKYWHVGKHIEKPGKEVLKKIQRLHQKYIK